MFTRRSILELIKAWVECDVISFHPIKSECDDNQIQISRVQDILTNAVQDFDWETRRKCTDILRAAVITIRKCSTSVHRQSIQCLCDVFHGTLSKLVRDCEYKVKLELVYCLQELKINAVVITEDVPTEAVTEKTIEVKTYDAFEFFVRNDMRDVKFEQLRHCLECIDFDAVMKDLKEMDDTVRNNPCSFLEDIIASTKQGEGNLLDCY